MRCGLIVEVRHPQDWTMKRCDGLGHQFYRCGNCRKATVKVFSTKNHDQECPSCKWRVVVSRESEEPWRGG